MGFQSDYLLRLIEMMGALLQRIMGRIAQGEPGEALGLADDAIEELTGLPAETIDAMTGEGLVVFLSAGGELDPEVARTLAALMFARAEANEAMGAVEGAERDRERAVALTDAARLL